MKTTRAKLKQIIKEETDFVVKEYNVFGNTSFGLGPHSDEDVSLQYDIEDYLDIYLEHPLDTSMPYEVAMHPNMIKVRYYIYEDLIKFCLNHAAGATSMPTRDYGFVDAEEEENKLLKYIDIYREGFKIENPDYVLETIDLIILNLIEKVKALEAQVANLNKRTTSLVQIG